MFKPRNGIFIRYQSLAVPNRLFKVKENVETLKRDRARKIPDDILKVSPKPNAPIFYKKNGYQCVEPYERLVYTTIGKINRKADKLTVLDYFKHSFIGRDLKFYESQINDHKLWILRPLEPSTKKSKKKSMKDIDLDDYEKIEGIELFDYELQTNDIIANYACIHELRIPEIDDIDIIYEDNQSLIVNKPSGMPVHPSGMAYKFNTLQYILSSKGYGNPKFETSVDPETLEFRSNLWTCHRIDKDTSGIVIFAKNPTKNVEYNKLIEAKKDITKKYLIRVHGSFGKITRISKHPIIEIDLAKRFENGGVGKPEYAKTEFHPIYYDKKSDTSFLLCNIFTGRKHQIRQHIKFWGFNIVNDPLYGLDGILKDKTPRPPNGKEFAKLRNEYQLQLEKRANTWDYESRCTNCHHITYSNPNPSPPMCLHALEYTYHPKGQEEPVWSFTARLPEWARKILPKEKVAELESNPIKS